MECSGNNGINTIILNENNNNSFHYFTNANTIDDSDVDFKDVAGLTVTLNRNRSSTFNETFDDSMNIHVYEDVIASILTVSVVASWITNFIVISVFLKFKCLRTKHDMLVINLAFTNVIMTVGISFYSTYTIRPGDLLHMKIVCMTLFMCINGGILIALFILLFLSVERYLCILHPDIHGKIKIRHVILFSILAYIVGLLYVVIPFVLKNNWDRYHLCVADVFPFEFSIVEQVCCILILSSITVINIIVFKTALSQVSKINRLLKSVQHRHKKRRHLRQKGKAFVTVFLISGISAICWVPILVVFSIESDPDLSKGHRWMLTQLLYVPVSVNSSVTAIIIGYRNRHFRDAIKSTLYRRSHECNRGTSLFNL